MLDVLERLVLYRRPLIVLIHLMLTTLAYLGAFVLRFEFGLPPEQRELFLLTLPLLLVIRMTVFAYWYVHEGLWRYVSMRDILAILKAVTLSSLVFVGGVLAVVGRGFPRSVFVLDWLLCLALVGGVRLTLRAVREASLLNGHAGGERRALVVGAGDAGEMLVREIERNPTMSYEVAGFVDDDRKKRSRRIHGFEVLGTVDELPSLARAVEADEVLIAVPSVMGTARRRILERCRESGLPFKTVPAMGDLLRGKAQIGHLQEVRLEDLLGREAVRLDLERLRRELAGRRILVTGAAGSIGSELCRQLAAFRPELLVLLDQAESALYFIDVELRNANPTLAIIPVIGNIRDRRTMDEVVGGHRIDLVYHAAAYKHVPLMEEFPLEGIANNVLGTDTVLRASIEHGVKKFVLISTDKAVRPVGTMGMTKRVAEDLLRLHSDGAMTVVAVRFGNVLGSDGSVLQLFQRQIARGGPVTLTDPEACRYFMLPSEAVQLVLQAGAMGRGGEVFFLDMGEPVRILDLARNTIRLAGLEPDKDIPIKIIGLRPGERLREALVTEQEDLLPTEHQNVFVVRNHSVPQKDFGSDLEELRRLVGMRDRDAAVSWLNRMGRQHAVQARG